jgi:hypothetical protein
MEDTIPDPKGATKMTNKQNGLKPFINLILPTKIPKLKGLRLLGHF